MSSEQTQKANRRKFLLLLTLMCAPVIVSYALYFFDFRPDSKHYGDLLPIVKVSGRGSNIVDNTILRMKDLHGKWVLVTVDSGRCDDIDPDSELIKEHEGVYFVRDKDNEIVKLFETADVHTKHIYLLDPIGNLMMRFPEKIDGKKMGNDIKRLLHVSQIEH